MMDAVVELKMNNAAMAQFRAIQLAAVTQVFEEDMLPKAQADSPVTAEGLAYNLAKGKKGVAATGTGNNRESLGTEVVATDGGVEATLFSTSGYGGYLEVGTSKMRAQPYLFPAFLAFSDKIADVMREKLSQAVA